jgi:eukaryotic-like serine/threonine-protein kinase
MLLPSKPCTNRMIGQTLNNRYKITTRLGKGAMGTVYRASDTQSGQEVALKIISSELVVDPDMLERFKREGEALSKLKHPNIVGFIDTFQHDENYVIVMEYISGGSLYDLIKAGPMPVERASQIALDLCDALIRSHRLKIIHRDIKPENILMDEEGTPKLADFGVARLSEGTRMTRSGMQVGTPYYMSPEAWEGKALDAQADIWSLGVILFEMLSGQVPFDGDTGPAVMTKVMTSPPPDVQKLRADTPIGLVNIITRMLTRDKNERYQTMREVAVDLERWELATTPVRVKSKPVKTTAKPAKATRIVAPSQSFRIGRNGMIVAVGFLIVAVLIAVNLTSPPGNNPEPTERSVSSTPTRVATRVTSTATTAPTATSIPVTSTPELGIGSTMVSEKDDMVIVYVPEGNFIMGNDEGLSDEKPAHTVFLDAFWIYRTEVTNGMHALCVQDGDCQVPSNLSSSTRNDHYSNIQYRDYPVIYVNWDDANDYCIWAGARLPTEAEWEKAARGTDGRIFPWGNEYPSSCLLLTANFCSDDVDIVGSHPSGASIYGALDMAGNVYEWINDWYDANYYVDSPLSNPKGPDSGQSHVLRGGLREPLRSSLRNYGGLSYDANGLGLRCALTP